MTLGPDARYLTSRNPSHPFGVAAVPDGPERPAGVGLCEGYAKGVEG